MDGFRIWFQYCFIRTGIYSLCLYTYAEYYIMLVGSNEAIAILNLE